MATGPSGQLTVLGVAALLLMASCASSEPSYEFEYDYPRKSDRDLRYLCESLYSRMDFITSPFSKLKSPERVYVSATRVTYMFDNNKAFAVDRTSDIDIQPGFYTCPK